MNFDQYATDGKLFIREISAELGGAPDENHAFRVTRAVLHTIRNIFTPEESTHLIAQLPMFIKAIYVDGWKIGKGNRIRSMEEFLSALRANSDRPEVDFGNDTEARRKVQAVMAVLQNHVAIGELSDMMDQFPGELIELFKSPAKQNS